MDANESSETLVKAAAALARLGVRSPSTLNNWERRGLVRVVRIGRRRFVPQSELNRLLLRGAQNGDV